MVPTGEDRGIAIDRPKSMIWKINYGNIIKIQEKMNKWQEIETGCVFREPSEVHGFLQGYPKPRDGECMC